MLEQDIGMHDVFVGVEHCLRGDELQQSANELGGKGYKVAADVARSTWPPLEVCPSRQLITSSRWLTRVVVKWKAWKAMKVEWQRCGCSAKKIYTSVLLISGKVKDGVFGMKHS